MGPNDRRKYPKLSLQDNHIRFFDQLAVNDMSHREDVFRDELDLDGNKIVIDTCYAPDVLEWETGIERNGESFVIVEIYDSREEAEEGHKKWVKAIQENPETELEEVRDPMEWFLG